MPLSLSCPSCNTAFSLASTPADGRADCPRCGDRFPIRLTRDDDGAGTNAGADPGVPSGSVPVGAGPVVRTASPSPHPVVTSPTTRPTNPAAATLLERAARARVSATRGVGLALLLGVCGLVTGLWVTRHQTAGVPPPGETPPPPPHRQPVPAHQLGGLGYLPSDTNLLFALQPAPILAYAARTEQDPTELLTRAGLPPQVLTTLANLGLVLPQIDHLAAGTCLTDDVLELRLALVLVLRRPLPDEDDFLRRLKAKKVAVGKARYAVELSGLPLTLARVSPTAWVFGYDAQKDLEAVEAGGRGPGGRHLPAALAEMVRERVPPEAAVWLATDDARWGDKPGVRLLVGQLLGRPQWLPVIGQGRAALAALSFADPPRLRLFVKAADERLGQQARSTFARWASDATTEERAIFGGAGAFAFFDTPIDPASVFGTLQTWLARPPETWPEPSPSDATATPQPASLPQAPPPREVRPARSSSPSPAPQ